ncbi:MAG: hypothetical protein RR955_02745 [Raoultibacter sp.]
MHYTVKKGIATRGRWIVFATTLGIAAALAAGSVPAFASTGTTEVTLRADSEQVDVTVPTTMAMAIKADGTFITPDAANTKIINNSIFDIHVSSIKATTSGTYQLVTQTTFQGATQPDSLWLSMTPSAGTPLQLGDYTTASAPTTPANWNMTKASKDGSSDEISLASAGAIKNISKTATTAEKALTVTFTVAAGTKN